MTEENLLDEEASILKDAETRFRDLPQASEDIAERSLALLREERELFDQAMVFQLAIARWVANSARITDDGLRAAISIACYTFNMLLRGWESLIRGFYAVALNPVRNIEQATITEQAVMLDPIIARKFLRNELEDGEASQALQRALAKENSDYAEEWGRWRRRVRNLEHELTHLRPTAVAPLILIADDEQSMMPIVGGFFNERRCQRIGRSYAYLAFKAAVESSQALKTVLPSDGKLKQQLDKLKEWGKPLIDSWEKEMGLI